MKVVYLVNWYNEKNPQRKAELIRCVEKTVDSMEVDVVLCIHEKDEECPVAGVTNVLHTHRPTYKDMFEIANKYAKKGDVVIISNTDIYPEDGVGELIENIKDNECFALARWDEDTNGNKVHLDRWDTADSWVFKAPIKIPANCDFQLGQAGCDNAINERLMTIGYKVSNPSKTVKFIHYQPSAVLNYTDRDRIGKPYLLITPHELGQEPSYNHITT